MKFKNIYFNKLKQIQKKLIRRKLNKTIKLKNINCICQSCVSTRKAKKWKKLL